MLEMADSVKLTPEERVAADLAANDARNAERAIRKRMVEFLVPLRDLRPVCSFAEMVSCLKLYRDVVGDPIPQAALDSFETSRYWSPGTDVLALIDRFGKGVTPGRLLALLASLRQLASVPIENLARIAVSHLFSTLLWGDVAHR